MEIHSLTSKFINQGKELLRRLRTTEANMLTDAEIRLLRVQLHLLDIEVSNRPYTTTLCRAQLNQPRKTSDSK